MGTMQPRLSRTAVWASATDCGVVLLILATRFITQAVNSAVTPTREPDLLDDPERVFEPSMCLSTLRPRHTDYPSWWLCQASAQGLGSSQVRAPF